ncbi:hypothetical protein C6P46_002619 [Rhodotorula mucilaginosa]|uniref:EamA domain-containing protein n=1 Tax=Rhodotorula mucilaginosa TaxID=5537 RepID=A0A9P7B997_RHOMI|nr:hypothetical protein C6P46_002619 [Rhodotorula mucilaginosa]TKA55181.1 hypothetical protein B0A53_02151 [Rhodotorula sp. CCFEE 5036]
MPRPRSRSRSPGPSLRSPVLVGAHVLPTVDARTPLPPPATPAGIPVEIQVQIDRSGYYLGTAMLLFVVLLWILGSFLMNVMFTDYSYNKPWLATWLCTSSFSLYLIRPALHAWRRKRRRRRGSLTPLPFFDTLARVVSKDDDEVEDDEIPDVPFNRPLLYDRGDSRRSLSRTRPSRNDMGRHLPLVEPVEAPLTTSETAQLAFMFCPLWFCANWAMNAALGYTSVSSTTILSSMSGFFTLAAGACVGVEIFTVGKLLSVILSVTGVVIVSLSDSTLPTPPAGEPRGQPAIEIASPTPSHPLLGDGLALLSALAYAAYVLLLKVRIRNEARISMTLFFGFVGMFNIVMFWPVGILLHALGVETFEWPHGRDLVAGLFFNAAITFVSDALYLRAMLLTSPLTVTLGLSLSIPLALIGDLVYRRSGEPVQLAAVVGGVLVLGSFVANGILDLHEAEKRAIDQVLDPLCQAIDEEEDERERLLLSEESEDGGRRSPRSGGSRSSDVAVV